MRFRAIQERDRRYAIRLMCRARKVSPTGYYAWRSRPESHRAVPACTVLSAIRVIHQESRETYGSPSIWDALIKQGHGVGEHRVASPLQNTCPIGKQPGMLLCTSLCSQSHSGLQRIFN